MDIERVSFESLANGGDDVTGALVKLDHDVDILADAATDLTTRVGTLETTTSNLDTRVTAAKSAADNAQTTASAALPKAGGIITGGINQHGTGNIIGYRMGRTDGGSGSSYYGSMWVNNGTQILLLATAANDTDGPFNALRPFTVDLSTGAVNFGSTCQFLVNLGVTGSVTANSVRSNGYATRAGNNAPGVFGANTFNVYWDTAASLWIDSTKIGNFAFATSDPRLKRDIVYVDTAADGDADQAKVLAIRPVTWYQKAVGIFGDDGQQRRSFLSPEVQDVDPVLAPGDRYAETEDGGVVPLNLNSDAMLSVLWGALRREIQLRTAIEARVAALEAASGA